MSQRHERRAALAHTSQLQSGMCLGHVKPSSNTQIHTVAVFLQILWTYILSQAAAAVVQQPDVQGVEESNISIPQQIAIAITEEEQIAAMALVVEELTSTPPEDPTSQESGATPATA